MHKRFAYLEKKQSSLAVILSPNGIYVVVTSKRYRRKMLKGTKLFVGKVTVASKTYSNAAILDNIRMWWEGIDDEVLFKRLLNSPHGQKPITNFDNILFVNFNTSADDFMRTLFLDDEDLSQDMND